MMKTYKSKLNTSEMVRRMKIFFLLLPGLGLIVIFISVVIGMALAQSFGFFNFTGGESKFSLDYWHNQLNSNLIWRSFFYSLKIALFGSILSVVVAYPLAIWLRKPFPGSGLLSALLKAPLLVHGLVAAFLYVNVISYSGFLNHLLMALNVTGEPLRMQNDSFGIGVIFLQVWKQMPFALLLLTGAVQAIGDEIIFAAQDLGANTFDRFRKIIVPLTLRSLQVSIIIIFIGAAGDYSFQVIAGPVTVNSMAQLMYRLQNQSAGWNDAAVVAVMLMVLSLVGSLVLAFIVEKVVKGGSRI